MKSVHAPGASIEFKRRSGLSSAWEPGTVVAQDGREYSVRDRRGNEHHGIPSRRVRAPKNAREEARRLALRSAGLVAPPLADEMPDLPRPRIVPAKQPTVRPAPEAIARAVEKLGPWRSPEYLAYVRELPCCVCGAPGLSDPSHHGRRGTGQKTDDYRTVPLCRRHHDAFHQHGVLEGRSRPQTDAFVNAKMLDLIGGFLKRHTLVPLLFETPPCRAVATEAR